ncbi:hypothetical protein TKK_0008997 [Trichogramma kaykai]
MLKAQRDGMKRGDERGARDSIPSFANLPLERRRSLQLVTDVSVWAEPSETTARDLYLARMAVQKHRTLRSSSVQESLLLCVRYIVAIGSTIWPMSPFKLH